MLCVCLLPFGEQLQKYETVFLSFEKMTPVGALRSNRYKRVIARKEVQTQNNIQE